VAVEASLSQAARNHEADRGEGFGNAGLLAARSGLIGSFPDSHERSTTLGLKDDVATGQHVALIHRSERLTG
jgi:hypothetical protein